MALRPWDVDQFTWEEAKAGLQEVVGGLDGLQTQTIDESKQQIKMIFTLEYSGESGFRVGHQFTRASITATVEGEFHEQSMTIQISSNILGKYEPKTALSKRNVTEYLNTQLTMFRKDVNAVRQELVQAVASSRQRVARIEEVIIFPYRYTFHIHKMFARGERLAASVTYGAMDRRIICTVEQGAGTTPIADPVVPLETLRVCIMQHVLAPDSAVPSGPNQSPHDPARGGAAGELPSGHPSGPPTDSSVWFALHRLASVVERLGGRGGAHLI